MYGKKHSMTHNQQHVILHNLNEAKKLPHPSETWKFEDVEFSKSFHYKLTAASMLKCVRKASDGSNVKIWRTKRSTYDYLEAKEADYDFEIQNGESQKK